MSVSASLRLLPLRLTIAAIFTGHYYIETSVMVMAHVGGFILYNGFADYAVTCLVTRHALKRILPKDLMVVGESQPPFDPSNPQRPFLKTTSAVGNLSLGVMADKGLQSSYTKRNDEQKEAALEKAIENHRTMLHQQGVIKESDELKFKKLDVQKNEKPDDDINEDEKKEVLTKGRRRRHRQLSVGSVRAKDA